MLHLSSISPRAIKMFTTKITDKRLQNLQIVVGQLILKYQKELDAIDNGGKVGVNISKEDLKKETINKCKAAVQKALNEFHA